MNSLEIREMEAEIIKIVNDAPVPLEVKRLIMLDVMGKIESATTQEINEQLKEREAEKKEDNPEEPKEGEIDA